MTSQTGTKAAFRKTFHTMFCAMALFWPSFAVVVRADDVRLQQIKAQHQRLREQYETARNERDQALGVYKLAKASLNQAQVKRLAAPGRVEQLKRDFEQQTQSLDDNITRVKIDIKMARRSLANSTIESSRERYRQQIHDAELNLRIVERQRARIVGRFAGPLRAAQANVEATINAYYDALRAAHARHRVYEAAHRQVVEVARKLEDTRREWVALNEAHRR